LRDELGVGATNVALDELKKKQKLDDTCYSRDDLKNNKALKKKTFTNHLLGGEVLKKNLLRVKNNTTI
jgi:hypothetical protein